MDWIKCALAVILIGLGFAGLILTWGVYVVLDDWNNLPSYSTLHIVGSRLFSFLPACLAIFSLMFELLGVYLLYESTKQFDNI